MVEYIIGKATVRIHPGKLSEEERKVLWKDETTKYLRAVQAARKKNQKSKEAAKAAQDEADPSDGVRNGSNDRGLL